MNSLTNRDRLMYLLRRLSLAACAALLSACATAPKPHAADAPAVVDTAAGATYLIVRHAEKAADDPRDPGLAKAGQARALRLAEALARTPLRAAYATGYRRTQATAAPAAAAHGLQVVVYDAKQPAAEFAAALRRDWPQGTVLVVAHSNTAPGIAAALCGCAIEPMGEHEYDRRMWVMVDAQGRAQVRVTRDTGAESASAK